MTSDHGAPSHLRHAFPWLIATLICVHACMAVTRVTAALWVLNHGYGEASVGLLLSLFAVAPIVLSLWAGRLADRHGFHRPVVGGVTLAFAGALGLAGAFYASLYFTTVECFESPEATPDAAGSSGPDQA